MLLCKFQIRGGVVIIKLVNGLLFLSLSFFSGYALGGDKAAGEERYKKTCINCHGPAGKGVASYPRISGNEIAYTKSKLETYRSERKRLYQDPNRLRFAHTSPIYIYLNNKSIAVSSSIKEGIKII